MLRVNLESPILLTQALLPGMLERDQGKIVLIGSLAGKAGSPRSSIYNATKFGLRGFAFGWAVTLSVPVWASAWSRPDSCAMPGCSPTPGPGPRRASVRATPDEVADAMVKAIEGERIEITVAPLKARVMAHFALTVRTCPTAPSPVRPGRRPPKQWPAARLTSDNQTNDQTREEVMSSDSFGAKADLTVDGTTYEIHRLDALQEKYDVARLPYSIKVLLENVLQAGGRRFGDRGRHRGDRILERRGRAVGGDPVPACPRADAGLHRRAGSGRPGRDARRD